MNFVLKVRHNRLDMTLVMILKIEDLKKKIF